MLCAVVLSTYLLHAQYEIPPVYVSAKKEDPAYTIMRKAIGMAPYYRNIVQSYRAEVYLKGNVDVTKLKGVIALALDKDQRNALKNLSGIQETVSEIQYTAPDKYVQTIKSEKTAANVDLKKLGIKEDDLQMGLANLNIYSNRPNMPLAPNAFQNYTFKYLGDSEIDGQWVVKIQVIPRRKANDLFTGYLFIIREKWCVYSLDLSLSQQYVKARGQQTYSFVSDNILLPVAYSVKGEFDGFGLCATGLFSGSMLYLDVKQNQQIAQTEQAAPQVKELLNKAELKPKEMRALRKIQDKTVTSIREEERKERGEKPSLEIVNNYKIEKDSARTQRDSAYWASVRPIPLGQAELKLYNVSDSIKVAPFTPEGKRKKGFEIASGILGSGHTFKIDSLWSISYSGVLNPFESGYNTVDGWVYGQAVRVRKETQNNGYIQLRGRLSRAFCREAWMWSVAAEQRYWTNKQAYWRLQVSSQSQDFAGDQGVGLVNDWSSLLFRVNPSRFYDSKRLDFDHRMEPLHGLVWSFGVMWEERLPLVNHSNYSLLYKDSRSFAPNIPDANLYVYDDPILIDQNRAAILRLALSYTPMQYYRMYQGRKTALSSKYPTFSAEWIKGLPHIADSQSDFDFVRLEVSQTRNFGYHNTFDYRAEFGTFLNAKQLYFADFHHIYANQSGVSFNRDLYNFQLPDTYVLSTSQWYMQVHMRYQTPYLALKYIPIFKNPMIRESIQLSYLHQPALRHYTEFGYSLNNLFMLMNAGFFVGFEAGKYRNWGFRFSVPLELVLKGLQL